MNVNEYDAALAIAKQAEAVTKDANIEQYIAQIYEEMGDNQNAIKFYQNAIKLVDSTSPMANGDIEYYQSKVDTLGGTSK